MVEQATSERSIFLAAIEQRSPEERAAFVDRACGDDARLREGVNELLAAHDRLATIHPAPSEKDPIVTTDEPSISEGPGTVIGPYKLLEQIGEGGFGVVFMAEQTQPMRRKVALKILKPGMDTRQVVARFEAERQALAIMDHPNIAKVLDGGATASGRPYFVMDLVKGVPITEHCDENHLTPRERLELFVSVCHAVQHAHHKGIVHRDLKPSNVLVTMHDTTPLVKVIDFGVAKALGQELTDKTLFTGFAQMIGTPLYMSPEQAGQSSLDIDTRSDIYSLGVLLYELLTGTTPFDKERFKQAAYDEIRRIIREEEPPKPSTRLSELGNGSPLAPRAESGRQSESTTVQSSLASVAAQRQTEPAKLTKLVRGELDWIVMKALEKDRNRRYETANGLAMDVQRYLADEPVVACPPSAGYRLRKFARRNKGPVLAASLIFVALLAAVVSMAVGLAAVERERARTAAERDDKSNALVAEATAREAEQQAREQAMAALRAMSDEIVENQMARGTELTGENKEFLRNIVKHFESFAAITANDAQSRAIRFEGHYRVGVMRYRLGELKEAEAAFASALAIIKQLTADFPARPEFRRQLATSHNSLALLLHHTGRLKQAEVAFADALAILKQLTVDFPSDGEPRQELAQSYNNLGTLFLDTSRLTEAEAATRDAIRIREQLATDFPNRVEYRHVLAMTHGNLGLVLRKASRLEEALTALAEALAIQKQLAADFPARSDFRQDLALSHANLGVLLREDGRLTEAEAATRDALAIQKQLAADFPVRPEFRRQLAGSQNNLGLVLGENGRLKEAEAAYADALAIKKQLVADFPSRSDFRQELALSHGALGTLLRDTGRPQEAEAAFADAVAIRKRLADEFPTLPELRQQLAESHCDLGNLLWDTGRLKEAQAVYADVFAIRNRLADEFVNQPDIENDLAGTLVDMANLCNQRCDFALAKVHLEEAQHRHEAALKANPRHSDYRKFYRNNLWVLTRANAGLLDQTSAVGAAEKLRDLGWDPPANAYDAAFALAWCIPIVENHAQLDAAQRQAAVLFYGDQAMAMLRYAVAKGFKDAPKMKTDTVLAPLRQREDFQKLLAELETNQPAAGVKNQESVKKP